MKLSTLVSTFPLWFLVGAADTDPLDSNTCQPARTRTKVINFSCLLIIIPITIIGNSLVCVVVGFSKHLRQQPMYVFLTSLATADMFCGLVSMPIKAKVEWDGGCFNLPWALCWIYVIFEPIISMVSTLSLFVIAIDRYIALKYPYRYSDWMTKKTCRIILLCIWVFVLAWSFLSVFRWDKPEEISIVPDFTGCTNFNVAYFTTTYVLWYIAPVFLMLFIYVFVYRIAARHINEISRTCVHGSSREKEANRRKKLFKTVRSIIIVFFAYAVCWMPCVIMILIVSYNEPSRKYFGTDWFTAISFVVINFLPHLNSTLNPFIYVISNNEFLSVMKSLSKKMLGRVIRRKSWLISIRGSISRDSSCLMDDSKDDGPTPRKETIVSSV